MGLFRKKKKRDVSSLPELPRFDKPKEEDIPKANISVEIPKYDSTFEDKNTEPGPVMGTAPDIEPLKEEDIPIREPDFVRAKPVYKERGMSGDAEPGNAGGVVDIGSPFRKDDANISVEVPEDVRLGIPDVEKEERIKVPSKVSEGRPVFVQIDDYKDALNSVEVLKQKIREVEYIIDRLNEIKSEEQVEISNCETALSKIKERLVGIDKKLFEI
tara:strand:+ start:3267 stop:3911 length:645 start_codon:yes stop_codon:yes gene_type:complete